MPTPTPDPKERLAAKQAVLAAPVYPTPVGARNSGIILFDWLAAMAMQAFVTHGIGVVPDRAMTEEEKDMVLAQRAYRMAGAMMKAREEAFKTVESGGGEPATRKTEWVERLKQGAAARQPNSAERQQPPRKVS